MRRHATGGARHPSGAILRALAAAVLLAILLASPAAAHDRSVSYSHWRIDGARARVTVRLWDLDVTRFPWAVLTGEARERTLTGYLTENLTLRSAGQPCKPQGPIRALTATEGHSAYEWNLECGAAGPFEISSALFLDVAPSHLHFARVRTGEDAETEAVLSADHRSFRLGEPGDGAHGDATLLGYVVLGIEHILTGYDHVVFLLALLLIAGSLGDVVRVVTGFTLAHSITLGLAVVGWVQPERQAIEALIGLSIVLVAVENVWLSGERGRGLPFAAFAAILAAAALSGFGHGQVPAVTLGGLALFTACYFGLLDRTAHPARLRWAVAFLFGLIHGFGFAGVLLEAELARASLARALFGFNAGVELGQLAIVALVWPLLHRATNGRRAHWRRPLIEFGSAAVLAVGMFWFVSRAYG